MVRLAAIPVPLPVALDPSAADWWMVALTTVAAITSLIVAVSALVSSSRARQIAAGSESARVASEKARRRSEYDQRLDDAIASTANHAG